VLNDLNPDAAGVVEEIEALGGKAVLVTVISASGPPPTPSSTPRCNGSARWT